MKLLACVVLLPAVVTVVLAQAEIRPAREFQPLRGTWSIDEEGGRGRIGGLPLTRTLTIMTTATELTLTKDGSDEVYRLDGTETSVGETVKRVTLVAGALAVTTLRTRHQRGYSFTNIVTDAYSASGDVLTVERQLSVAVQPDPDQSGTPKLGHLVELENPGSNRQTMVYRRQR
jgi:hypothetical protein